MMEWYEVTLIGVAAGVIGAGTGGLIALFFSRPSNRVLGFMLGLSAGIMLAIVFLELLEESLEVGFFHAAAGLLVGILVFIWLDSRFPHYHFVSEESRGSYLKKGGLIAIGIGLHNFPEGVAIGAGFALSEAAGITLAILIGLHNIPEGLAIALPLNVGGSNRFKTLLITILAGLPIGLGALLGSTLATISPAFLSLSMGFAGGAMLYVVSDELIPDVYHLTNPHVAILGITSGVLLGMALIYYLH